MEKERKMGLLKVFQLRYKSGPKEGDRDLF